MGHCQDCRWWDGEFAEGEAEGFHGECLKIVVPDVSPGMRGQPYIAAILDPDGIEKSCPSAEECTIWLSTPPTFGCSLFEARE